MRVASLGHRVFADEIKLKRSHIELGQALNMTGVFIRRWKFGHRQQGACSYEDRDRDRDWSDVSTKKH